MKRILLLLTIICLISCNNRTNTNTRNNDSVDVDKKDAKSQEEKNKEFSLRFASYLLYTCEEDKYDYNGYHSSTAIITINERRAYLKLFDDVNKKCYSYKYDIEKKIHQKDSLVTYVICGRDVFNGIINMGTNKATGKFVNINIYISGNDTVSCWMQEGKYKLNTLVEGNSKYKIDTIGRVVKEDMSFTECVVVYEGNDDYYILRYKSEYDFYQHIAIEKYTGMLHEGDKVCGDIYTHIPRNTPSYKLGKSDEELDVSKRFRYFFNRSRNSKTKIRLESCIGITYDAALKFLGEKGYLKEKDQKVFDANN